MARDVYFRDDVGNVLRSLASGADRYHTDYTRALVAVAVAFGVRLEAPPERDDLARLADSRRGGPGGAVVC